MKYPLIAALFLLFASASALFLRRAQRTDWLRSWNRAFVDQLVSATASRRKDAEVTFLRVCPADFEKGDLAPRLDWAILLNSLLNFQPQAAGIVPPLRWDDRDALTEGALAKQVKRMPAMALGAILSPSPSGEPREGTVASSFLSLERVTGDRSRLLEAGQVAAMPDEELLINGRPGFTHIELQKELESGPNGMRFPLVCRLGERVVPSFVLQMVILREGLLPGDIQIRLDSWPPQVQLGDAYIIPVDDSGCMEVHPALADAFPQVDFTSLALAVSPFQEVAEELRKATQEELDSLRKNAVIIGFDDVNLQEFSLPARWGEGSGERKVSRAHLLCMAVAAIQSGFHLTGWPQRLRHGALGALVLAGLLVLALPRWLSAVAGLAVTALYLAAAWYVFRENLSWTPPWIALSLGVLMTVLGGALPRKPRRRRWFRSKL